MSSENPVFSGRKDPSVSVRPPLATATSSWPGEVGSGPGVPSVDSAYVPGLRNRPVATGVPTSGVETTELFSDSRHNVIRETALTYDRKNAAITYQGETMPITYQTPGAGNAWPEELPVKALALMGMLLRLSNRHGPITIALARASRNLMRKQKWLDCGFRQKDFAREHLERSSRWLYDMNHLADCLEENPLLEKAVLGLHGRVLGRDSAITVANLSAKYDVPAMIEFLQRHSRRALKDAIAAGRIRERTSGEDAGSNAGSDADAGAGKAAGADNSPSTIAKQRSISSGPSPADAVERELQRHSYTRISMKPQLRQAFEECLELFRACSGRQASVREFIEALLGVAAAEGVVPEDDPERDRPAANSRAQTAQTQASNQSRTNQPTDRLANPPTNQPTNPWLRPDVLASLDTGADINAETNIPNTGRAASQALQHARQLSRNIANWCLLVESDQFNKRIIQAMNRLIRIDDELSICIGQLLCELDDLRLWKKLGFRHLTHFAEDLLGLSPSKAREWAKVARALQKHQGLREAHQAGKLGFKRILYILRRAGKPGDAPQTWADRIDMWLEHTKGASLKLLEQQENHAKRTGQKLDKPPEFRKWHQSIRRTPGQACERVLSLGLDLLQEGPSAFAEDRLTLRLPQDLAADFLDVLRQIADQLHQQARLPLTPAGESRLLPSDRIARLASKRGRPPSRDYGLMRLLEQFVLEYDRLESGRRRKYEHIYERDGFMCSVPGCTARAVECHHIKYRSHQGGDEPENLVSLCPFHHRQGEHGELASVWGIAPLGLLWRLGTGEFVRYYRNERRVDMKNERRVDVRGEMQVDEENGQWANTTP